jgi:hypothetical protein
MPQLLGFLFKDSYELCANDLPLLLGIDHALELVQESFPRIHNHKIHVVVATENLLHVLSLALS